MDQNHLTHVGAQEKTEFLIDFRDLSWSRSGKIAVEICASLAPNNLIDEKDSSILFQKQDKRSENN